MQFALYACATLLAVGFLFPAPAMAIPGIPDDVPAATLVTPFFEVDPSGAQDTLLVVSNVSGSPSLVHVVVWDVNGNPVPALSSEFTLGARDSASFSVREIVAESAPAQIALLRGERWRGFVTFDVVSSSTSLLPIQEGYPFGESNSLEGWIYFTRLAEGSSNGLAMIPIEFVGLGVDEKLTGFYQDLDGREEIDSHARECTRQLASGSLAPCDGDADGFVDYIDSRLFLDPALEGRTRLLVFAWSPGQTGGPGGDSSYVLFDESGAPYASGTISFGDVVSVIDVPATHNGWAEIATAIPRDREVFAFVFNSARPADAMLNWDALFVSRIKP